MTAFLENLRVLYEIMKAVTGILLMLDLSLLLLGLMLTGGRGRKD